jgi:conserved oligomeric Golgi complex subunit 3
MVLDVPNVGSDDEEDESISKSEDEDGSIASRSRPRGLGRLHISRLLQMVLQDAQTRLFFKAQSIIQAEIRYYVPKPEDLAYPEKLVGASGARGVREF